MKPEFYKQCTLEKSTENGVIRTTSWIPEEFATVGKHLILKGIDGWFVVNVGTRQEYKHIKDLSHNSNEIWGATSGKYPRGNK